MEDGSNGQVGLSSTSSSQTMHTFESSTAVIKLSGGDPASDSDSFASETDEDDPQSRDAPEGPPSPDPGAEVQTNHVDSGGAQQPQQPTDCTEESWRSDSGFNSDTPTAVRHDDKAVGSKPDPGEDKRWMGSGPPSVSAKHPALHPNGPAAGCVRDVLKTSGSSAVEGPDASLDGTPRNGPASSLAAETLLRRRSSSGVSRERFNPFNKVPYIDDDHYQDIGSFPSVSGTCFAADREDYGTPRHENQSTSSDTDTEVSLPSKDLDLALITNEDLGITEDHFSHPEGCFGFSRVEELELAIEMCKESVKETREHSEQRRELINRLVQLRMKLLEIKEGTDEDPDIKLVLGHKFVKRKGKSSNHQCEMCNSIIWGMLQSWHRCLECSFSCHSKCLNFVKRQCASTKITKRGYVLQICPESGLAAQHYRCAECRVPLSFKGDTGEPRQCDYDGYYYCSLCHWNDTEVIPARVIHNWDFETRKVCRQSKQYLKLMQRRAVLCLHDLNPMLFNYVEELSQIKKLREEVLVMKMYFVSCRKAMDDKLLLQLQNRPHFVDGRDAYSLQDLIDAKDNSLLASLSAIHSNYAVHIRIECPLCQARGFICELCNSDEILYPFDMIATVCSHCSSVFHRDCFYKSGGDCPKCERLSKRTSPEER